MYYESKPTQPLQHYVHSYWWFEIDPARYPEPFQHTILADGCISLVFICIPGMPELMRVFTGPTVKNPEIEVYPGAIYIGVRFLPSIPFALFGIEGIALREKRIPADPFLKDVDFSQVYGSLSNWTDAFKEFDKILISLINSNPPRLDYSVLKAAQEIMESIGQIRIAEVVKNSAMSERHLQRRFKQLTGLTLKEFARVRRIRASTIEMMLDHKASREVIQSAGFNDRSHFNHEFMKVTGLNPTGFKTYIDQIDHVDVNRK